MIKKKLGLVIAFTLVFALTFTFIVNAASVYWYLGYGTTSIPMHSYALSTYKSAISDGIESWNSNSDFNFYLDNSSDNSLFTNPYADTFYGRMAVIEKNNNEITEFTIKINTLTIEDDAINLNNFIRSVLVHELGHVIYLDDNPPGTYTSIMRSNRNRNIMVNPSITDVINAEAKYW